MPTPRDTARTWRDIADTLTNEQVAYCEYWERHPASGGDNEAGLLRAAREFAGSNAAAALPRRPTPNRSTIGRSGCGQTTTGRADSAAPTAPSTTR
jgi:hypothetical protein